MTSKETLNTHQKALEINLDPTSYGSFAEIGAGQEVARWFLVVGGASGTVAKSISAYDKEVSDDLYGSGARYVSKDASKPCWITNGPNSSTNWTKVVARALASFRLSIPSLHPITPEQMSLTAGSVCGSNCIPATNPAISCCISTMRDPSSALQQESIGILGVNLIYAVFYQLQTKESFLENVVQDVEERIEIDFVELHGAAFEAWDQRAILVHVVRAGLAEAVCFSHGGSPAPPIEVLHKKAVVLAPGSFEHVDPTHGEIHERMLASAVQQLRRELGKKAPAPIGFFCLSAMPLTAADPPSGIPDLLKRIDALLARGGDVLLFGGRELYNMTALVNRYTTEHIRFVVGLSLLIRVFEHRFIKLPGSLLEALSRLLAQNVRIYAYPMRAPVPPFPPVGSVAAPFGSPAVPHLPRYYRERAPTVSLGVRLTTLASGDSELSWVHGESLWKHALS